MGNEDCAYTRGVQSGSYQKYKIQGDDFSDLRDDFPGRNDDDKLRLDVVSSRSFSSPPFVDEVRFRHSTNEFIIVVRLSS